MAIQRQREYREAPERTRVLEEALKRLTDDGHRVDVVLCRSADYAKWAVYLVTIVGLGVVGMLGVLGGLLFVWRAMP